MADNTEKSGEIQLGQGFRLRFTSWSPDRRLNPQYAEIPNVEKIGAILTCRHDKEGSILFHLDDKHDGLFPNHPHWQVISWEPLTLDPSIDSGCCHGYIRDGRWLDV